MILAAPAASCSYFSHHWSKEGFGHPVVECELYRPAGRPISQLALVKQSTLHSKSHIIRVILGSLGSVGFCREQQGQATQARRFCWHAAQGALLRACLGMWASGQALHWKQFKPKAESSSTDFYGVICYEDHMLRNKKRQGTRNKSNPSCNIFYRKPH